MKDNQHVQAIPTEVLTQAQTKVDELKTLLAPYILALTPSERHKLPKMGEKTIGFVEKSYNFAKQNPNLCPPYLDMTAFDTDFDDAHGLWTLLNTVQQLHQNLDDTEMAAGSEAYQAALLFYSSVKTAAAQDVPGAKAVYNELRTHFPGGKRKSTGTESENVTEIIKKEVKTS
ncbi:hypothetical protein FACS1894172_03460 [Spirochaetia bacterium]|nr:hypothetical protein FACS1894164_19000 [Spirochaetia bacterium]GHU30354.1 hypothetical protein FACS1894172_03460 [Spirochaetia bacterium]